MKLENRTVLITGGTSGIGLELAKQFARRDNAVILTGRDEQKLDAVRHALPGVHTFKSDVSDPAAIATLYNEIVSKFPSLDILINNAGISLPDGLSDRAALEAHLAVNLYGTYDVTQAFLPALSESCGAIVNVVSLAAFAAVPVLPAYSASKAAEFSLSQSLRALLAGRGVSVLAVLPGPVDTEMARGLDIPKASPEYVAAAILDGVENGEEEIFPDPMSVSMADGWRGGFAKAFERQNTALLPEPVAA